jgi:5-methyltetrahydrofolate--homocysteine methyltransferase
LKEKIPLDELMKQKIVLFDGAMGTEIQKLNPKPEDFPDGKEGFNDGLSFTRPDWIKNIHRSYIRAGADCIETNSFGSNKIKLAEYGYGDKTLEYNKKIAELAVKVTEEFSDNPIYVIGSMGPTGFLPSSNDASLGQIKLDEIQEAFEIQAEGLILGGVDALLIETSQDILEVKLAIIACHNAFKKTGKRIPIIANVTLDKYGKMLLGTNIQAAYTTVSEMGIDAFGLNCSTGPMEMIPSIQWLNEQDELPLLVVPNAGMPENQGGRALYKMDPQEMAKVLADFLGQYPKVRIIGGCCGTNPDHISLLRKVIDEKATENNR